MKISILLTVLLTCLLPQAVFAARLRVPRDYPTIQAAVDAAEAGDTVMLSDGTYAGEGNCSVNVAKSIRIVSKHGPDRTIMECPDSDGFYLDLGAHHCPESMPIGSSQRLRAGTTYYADRDYTLTGVPSQYEGLTMFGLFDNHRDRTDAAGYVAFGAHCGLDLYVAYDSRATALPDWMAGFSYTGDDLYTSLAAQDHLKIYKRSFTDGECVDLGANKAPGFAGGEVDNYVVFFDDHDCSEVSIEGLTIRNARTAIQGLGRNPATSELPVVKPMAVRNCSLVQNDTGITIDGTNAEISDCNITGNDRRTGVILQWAAAGIFDSHIENHLVGIHINESGARIVRSWIGGNSIYGASVGDGSSIRLYNSIINGNGDYALMMEGSTYADIFNATVFGNMGGIQLDFDSSVLVTNSILRQNGVEVDGSVYNYLDLRNSNVEGGVGGIGSPVNDLGGNIDEDPRFIDPDGADDIPGTADDNLHLGPRSPCINAGTADLPDDDVFKYDIDGDRRIIGPAPDMGADEARGKITCPKKPHAHHKKKCHGRIWTKRHHHRTDRRHFDPAFG